MLVATINHAVMDSEKGHYSMQGIVTKSYYLKYSLLFSYFVTLKVSRKLKTDNEYLSY